MCGPGGEAQLAQGAQIRGPGQGALLITVGSVGSAVLSLLLQHLQTDMSAPLRTLVPCLGVKSSFMESEGGDFCRHS